MQGRAVGGTSSRGPSYLHLADVLNERSRKIAPFRSVRIAVFNDRDTGGFSGECLLGFELGRDGCVRDRSDGPPDALSAPYLAKMAGTLTVVFHFLFDDREERFDPAVGGVGWIGVNTFADGEACPDVETYWNDIRS